MTEVKRSANRVRELQDTPKQQWPPMLLDYYQRLQSRGSLTLEDERQLLEAYLFIIEGLAPSSVTLRADYYNWFEVQTKKPKMEKEQMQNSEQTQGEPMSERDKLRYVSLKGELNSVAGLNDLAEQFDRTAHECDSAAHEVSAIAMRWAVRRIEQLESMLRELTGRADRIAKQMHNSP